VLNLKSAISNKKILESYLIFKKKFISLKKKIFIVGVSGGPDSLALVALSKMFCSEKKVKFYYVLVDHGIRANSGKEALQVKALLKKYSINLHILKNKIKVKNNIQSKARQIRYDLLKRFAKKKNINYILTGHHSDDQVETFLIRLSRGSGIQGLSSMKIFTNLSKGIILFRPLLDQKKKDLIYISKKFFTKVFKDPSNKNKKFLRTKIRSLTNVLEKSGIHHDQIIKSINNIASSNNVLNDYIIKTYKNNVRVKKKEILIDYKKLSLEAFEIQLKVISKSITLLSNSYYPPRSKKISDLIKKLNKAEDKKFTLSRCIIERSKNFISIKKEVNI